ncbi:serine/threonine-protein kinase [Streptomyces sp. NPDC101158]|uniref:serine/threonine-protein kinase n=1 Tax=Streptomyces sp. NPDC101158 TaxID=3366117 RepID=UPI0037FCD92D
MIGEQIARYRVLREIGRGETSVVYLAEDLPLNRMVALKLFAPDLAASDTFRSRLAQDSRAAAVIDHPHIVPVFDVGETDGVLYMAMRYVPGFDLRTLLDREGTLSVSTTLRIADQVASALDAAHGHDLVHGDVRPGKILGAGGTDSEHSERVYLTGFGQSKTSLMLSGFTSAGSFVATLAYMAPEQLAGRPVDGRTDQYSLACVVYESLAGRPPFERDSDMALMLAQAHEPPPGLPQTSDIRPAVDAVLAKALAKSPKDRYPSCQDFVAELRTAAIEPSAAADPLSPPGRLSPSKPMFHHPPSPADEGESSTPPGPPFGDDDDEW